MGIDCALRVISPIRFVGPRPDPVRVDRLRMSHYTMSVVPGLFERQAARLELCFLDSSRTSSRTHRRSALGGMARWVTYTNVALVSLCPNAVCIVRRNVTRRNVIKGYKAHLSVQERCSTILAGLRQWYGRRASSSGSQPRYATDPTTPNSGTSHPRWRAVVTDH